MISNNVIKKAVAVIFLLAVVASHALDVADVDSADGPPPGSRCTGHSSPPPLGMPSQIFRNNTVLPLDFNISEGCPRLPKYKWTCCQKVQYDFMIFNLKIMDRVFTDCDACNVAIRDMWCHYTCSPYQGLYDDPLNVSETGQILSTQLNVTRSFADRLWQSCRNSIFSNFEVKVMFPSVRGLFGVMASGSPPVYGHTTGNIVHDVYIDDSSDTTALNTTLVENEFECSRPHPPRNKRDFPLPKAMIGSMPTASVVGIILGGLLIFTFFIGIANSQHDQNDEDEAERESLMTSARLSHDPDGPISSMVTLDGKTSRNLEVPTRLAFAGGANNNKAATTGNGNGRSEDPNHHDDEDVKKNEDVKNGHSLIKGDPEH